MAIIDNTLHLKHTATDNLPSSTPSIGTGSITFNSTSTLTGMTTAIIDYQMGLAYDNALAGANKNEADSFLARAKGYN